MKGGDGLDYDTSSLNSIQSRSISQAVIDHYKEKILEMEPEVCVGCVSSCETVLGGRHAVFTFTHIFYSLGCEGIKPPLSFKINWV